MIVNGMKPLASITWKLLPYLFNLPSELKFYLHTILGKYNLYPSLHLSVFNLLPDIHFLDFVHVECHTFVHWVTFNMNS